MSDQRKAELYRMVLPDEVCPFGLRAKQLLEEAGYSVEDHLLTSRDKVEAFKTERGLSTTPLIIIDGKEIGGASDLERYLAEARAS